MLKYNPAERIAAKTALDHPYFDSLDKSQFWCFPFNSWIRLTSLSWEVNWSNLLSSSWWNLNIWFSVAFRHISVMFGFRDNVFSVECKTQWCGYNGKIASLFCNHTKICYSLPFSRCHLHHKRSERTSKHVEFLFSYWKGRVSNKIILRTNDI